MLVIVGPSVTSTVCPRSRGATGSFGDGILDAISIPSLLIPRPLVVEVHVNSVSYSHLVCLRVLNLLPLPLLVAALEIHGLATRPLNVILQSISPLVRFSGDPVGKKNYLDALTPAIRILAGRGNLDDVVEPIIAALMLEVAIDIAGEVLRPLAVFRKDVGAFVDFGDIVTRRA